MMNGPQVSILMPVHNAAPFLADVITSILDQTFSNWELIAVDDYSTDESLEILYGFEGKDQRIKVIRNVEKGIIPALSSAYACSVGNYITRMDADDLMPFNKLEVFIKAIENKDKTVVTGMVKYFSESEVTEGYRRYETWLNSLVHKSNYWKWVYRECIVASPNWMVPRRCFEEAVKLDDLVYPEDYAMVFKWYAAGYKIVGIPEVTHLWREHPNRTSRKVKAYQQEAFFHLKTNRFIDLELKEGEKVQLIGAGAKGKLVAQELFLRNVPFDWFDLNSKNHNTAIQGKEILPVSSIDSQFKSILTVWPISTEKQAEIVIFMKGKGFFLGKNYWLF